MAVVTTTDIAKKKGVSDTIKVKQRKWTKLVKPSGPPPKNTPTLPARPKLQKQKKTPQNNIAGISGKETEGPMTCLMQVFGAFLLLWFF